jgi:hypothetical protein
VSKKTVTFKMPVKSLARAEDESRQGAAPDEEPRALIFERASGPSEQAGASGQDDWVRSTEADHAHAAAQSFAHGVMKSVTIDLTAERDFPNVAALMLMVPPMLGWFYLANVMNRYWNRLG